jgi:hypothetical protein
MALPPSPIPELCGALAQDGERAVTLCDGGGDVVAQHDPLPSADGGLRHVDATRREDGCIDRN